MEIGRKILNLRRDLGLRQSELAHRAEITPSALSRIESQRHQPKAPVAWRLSRELGVTCDYLLDAEQPYPAPPRVLLASLEADDTEEPTETFAIRSAERRLIESVRKLEPDQRRLISEVLSADRQRTRFALYILGGRDAVPDADAVELERFESQIRGSA